MLKKGLRVVSSLVALSTLLTVAACGGNGGGYDPLASDEIKVVVSSRGYGTAQYEEIAKAFEATHPGKKVYVESTVASTALTAQLEANSFIGDVCMFNDNALWKLWRSGKMVTLDDVVSAIPDGEEKSVGEKCDSNLMNAYKVSDGHYYSIPWMNENVGLVYNKTALNTLLGENAWELPKTTIELYALCDRIKTAGGYGFVWESAYLSFIGFEAQYSGYEQYLQNSQGYYYDETTNAYKLSDNTVQCIKNNTGYLRTLEQIEKILSEYSHQYSRDMDFIQAQSTWAGIPYAGDSKLCVFMPNGDWAYNETKEFLAATGHKAGFMNLPVMSDIVETLELYEDGDTPFSKLSPEKQSIYDAKLRAIIDYVDGETVSVPTGVGQNDINRVAEARSYIEGKAQGQAFIPYNSKKIDLAKEFLVFMASDMAVNIYSQYTNGLSPWVTDTTFSNISFDVPFMQDVLNVVSLSKAFAKPHNELSLYFPKTTSFDQGFGAGTHTAKMIWENDVKWYKEQWPTILKNAGLSNN